MTTTPPSPTLRSRYSGADGGRGRVGAVHRTLAVVFRPAALALTVDWPCVAEVKANVARPPTVVAVAAGGVSSPVPEAANVTTVPSATGRPDGSSTSAATRRSVPAGRLLFCGDRLIEPVAAAVQSVASGAACTGPAAPGTEAVTVLVPVWVAV